MTPTYPLKLDIPRGRTATGAGLHRRAAQSPLLPAGILCGGMAAVLAGLILLPAIHVPEIVPGADKIVHVGAFAALILPAALTCGRAVIWIMPLLLAFGSVLELLQSCVGRSSSWGDAAANAGGIVLGALLGRAVALAGQKLSDRRTQTFRYATPEAPLLRRDGRPRITAAA